MSGQTTTRTGLRKIVVRGLGVTALSNAIEGVLQIGVLMVLARQLAPDDFGLMSAVMVVVGVASISYQLGIGPALIQRPVVTTRHLAAGFWFTNLLAALLFGLVYWGADTIAYWFNIERLAPYLRVGAFLFIIEGFGVVPVARLSRDLQFKYLAVSKVASYAIGYGAIGVGCAYAGLGAAALIAAQVAQSFVHTLLAFVKRPTLPILHVPLNELKELLRFGGGFTLGRFANYAATNGDNFVAARYLGAEALGVYGRAYQLLVMPSTLFGRVVDRVLFPVVSGIQNEPKRVLKAYEHALATVAVVVMPLSVLTIVNAQEIVRILLGPGWMGVVVPFQILAIGSLSRTNYKISDSVVRALGLVYQRALVQVVYGVLVIGGAFVGVQFGLSGLSSAVLFAVTANYMMLNALCYSKLGGRWRHFVHSHLVGIVLTILAVPLAMGTAFVGRMINAYPVTILAGSGAITVAVCFVGLWIMYRMGLGGVQAMAADILVLAGNRTRA